jgi:hypothetical protein
MTIKIIVFCFYLLVFNVYIVCLIFLPFYDVLYVWSSASFRTILAHEFQFKGQLAHWRPCLKEYNFTCEQHQSRKFNNADALYLRPRGNEYIQSKDQGAGRRQGSSSYCSCSHRRLGTIHNMERRVERPKCRSNSRSRGWTMSGMERHCRLQPHIQGVLSPMEVPWSKGWHTDGHWESADRRSKIARIIRPRSKAKDVLAKTHSGPPGDNLGVNKTLGKITQRYCWLQARNDVK